MPETTQRKTPRSSPRKKRGADPARSDAAPFPAHRFVFNLVTTLSELRGSLERIYHPSGLNDHKFAILSTLAAQSPQPSLATELARAIGVTRASMTDLLDDLERRRWIERRRDRADRRVIHIHLTSLGREVLAATEDHFAQLCEQLLGPTQPRELSRLADLCERLSHAVRTLASHTPPFQPPSLP